MYGFSDADFAGDLRTRRSTSGYAVFCMGGIYAWGSKLMTTIATSTMESEYMSAYYLGQQILNARGLLSELKLALQRPTPFFMDAMGAIQALKNPTMHSRTKHIDIKFKWLASMEGETKAFIIHHVRTGDMTADLLTKAVSRLVFISLLKHLLGLEIRASYQLLKAQERAKGDDFPK